MTKILSIILMATAVVALLSASLLTATINTPQWEGTPVFLPYIEKPFPTATPTPLPTATPLPTSTPLPTATPTPIPLPGGANRVCATSGDAEMCAWVSNGNPNKNTTVAVYGSYRLAGQPVAGQSMSSTWYYKSTTVGCSGGASGSDGISSCSRSIGNASSGYRVDVVVIMGGIQATTWFTPN